jgi:flavin prenyltransferase
MAIVPASMRNCAAISIGLSDNLLTRAADVMLKERRRLVLLPREAPLSEAHLEAMLKLTRMGAIVAPPVPPFYVKPTSLDDVVREIAARTLLWLGVDPGGKMTRWGV